MPIQLIFLVGLVLLFSTSTHGQDLLKDNHTLKLTKVSTNKKYGYSEKKPVKLGGMNGKIKASQFFAALRGPNEEPIKYNRLGSCCFFKTPNALIGDKGLLDKYSVYYGGLEEPLIVYINEYDYEEPLCPKGFTYRKEESVKATQTMDPMLLKKVTACTSEKPYLVYDDLLLKALGYEYYEEEQLARITPRPKEGQEALERYFEEKSLTDERAIGTLFMVRIGFLVNCKGEAGNYFIITKGRGDLEELANQVLEVVNELNIEWLPAEQDGQAVDSYQVLDFSVSDGNLSRVGIKK
ncbi:MAG: hypothetical protein ACRBFS_25570 [Aureispira sp.]